jgi:succinyl-diaminopimelate desuccinylase
MGGLSSTLELAQKLIGIPSISPDDGGCQQLLTAQLEELGFEIEHLPYGDVSNFWATRGDASPLFVFAGHTDVVPSGLLDDWIDPPFLPTIKDGFLYGRGAADMKGSLAAMVTAVADFVASNPHHKGSIGFLITSDEEADAVDGTVKVVRELKRRGVQITWCLVGEPSSETTLGDTVKIGRRGSLNGRAFIKGTQGHVAYPALADNPIHKSLAALAELVSREWDGGDQTFPPTSLQISSLHAGSGAVNVIPGSLEVLFNFRYSPQSSVESLQQGCQQIFDGHGLDYSLEWNLSGEPVLTSPGQLITAVEQSIQKVTGGATALSTSGGTSDGRFISPTGAEVVELGPVNQTIHKANECVSVNELDQLAEIYGTVLEVLLT